MARKKKLTPAQQKEEIKKYEQVLKDYEITNIKPEVVQKSFRLKEGALEGTNIGVRILEDDLKNPDFLEWIYNQKKLTFSLRLIIEDTIRKYGTGDLSEQFYPGIPIEPNYNQAHNPLHVAAQPLANTVEKTSIPTATSLEQNKKETSSSIALSEGNDIKENGSESNEEKDTNEIVVTVETEGTESTNISADSSTQNNNSESTEETNNTELSDDEKTLLEGW